jgi:hypothetical protein
VLANNPSLPDMLRVSVLCAALAFSPFVSAQSLQTVLNAHFDDKTVGQPIGLGGAALGEPVALSAGISTEVVVADTGRALSLAPINTAFAQRASFEFLDLQEITAGKVRILLEMRPTSVTLHQVTVREQGGAASSFLNLNLGSNGDIRAAWAGNSSGVVIGTYQAADLVQFQIDFDMDLGTFSISVNGTEALSNQAHGVSTGRGIGRVNVGFGSSPPNPAPLLLDRLQVLRSAALDAILQANFDDKPLATPIGTGGPTVGEPISLDSPRIETAIVEAADGRALSLTRAESATTSAASIRFEFLESREVTRGPIRISARLQPLALGRYALRTREAGSSARRWIDIEFSSTGNLSRQVGSGPLTVIGTYAADEVLDVVLLGDFNARTYRILINGQELDSGTFAFDPGTRGVGSVLFSFLSGAENFGKSVILDNLRVETLPSRIFSDRFQ